MSRIPPSLLRNLSGWYVGSSSPAVKRTPKAGCRCGESSPTDLYTPSNGAPFHGALPAGPGGLNVRVNNIVDLLPNGGGGYWLVGAEGAIYSFGDAPFFGSLPGILLQPAAPVSELQQRPDGQDGYVLVADDDGTFAFPL